MSDKYREAENILSIFCNREMTREKSKEGNKVQANIGTYLNRLKYNSISADF